MNGKNIISQPTFRQSQEGGDRSFDERGAQLHSGQQSTHGHRTIRYFSMFTGVGGFDLGFQNLGSPASLSKGWVEDTRSPSNIPFGRNQPSHEAVSDDLSERKGEEQGRNEGDGSDSQQVGLSSQQFACVGFSEIDKYASQVLRKRFPNIPNFGDCTKINAAELPDFDMLCGGFPCQAFSIAGKRRGFQDTRGTLFFEVARILEAKRPKLVLLENVKGLLNHNKGETFRVIIQALEELGYVVQWMVLNSKFHGVPQNRERVFIIGNLGGTSRPEILPFGEVMREASELCGHEAVANTVHSRLTADSNGTYIESGGRHR